MKLSKINISLIFVITSAVLFQIFLFIQKQNLHIDEIFSFILANNKDGIYLFKGVNFDNNILSGHYLTECLMGKNNGSFVDLWNRVSQDNHMPIFFILLHAFNIFNNTVFTPLSGEVLNIFILFFLLIGFYKLSFLIFRNKNLSVICLVFFAFSQFVLSLEVYIRMYLLLMAFSVWLVYYIGQYFLYKQNKNLAFVFVFTFLTILTHYYSFIFCFLLAFFFCLFLLFNKNYKYMFLLGFTMLSAVIVAYLSFPTMINTGFYGERGSQFWAILKDFEKYPLSILKNQLPLFIDTIFKNICFFIMYISLFLFLYRTKIQQDEYILILFFVFLFYGCLASLVMPVMEHYQIRYFAPIISLFVLLNIYMINTLLENLKIKKDFVFLAFCCLFLFIFTKNVFFYKSPFYMLGTLKTRKMENIVKNSDIWWGDGGRQYIWMLHLYIDKLANADKVWILSDYDNKEFVDFSNQEIENKKYAYLFMPIEQEQDIEGGKAWIKNTTGRTAYYLFTNKIEDETNRFFEATVYLVCPF